MFMSTILFYREFLLCVGATSLFFGLVLLFFTTPDVEGVYKYYRRSKMLLAAGYLVMSLNITYWGVFYNDRFITPTVTDIYNEVIAIYLLYIIFHYALCNLLDHHYLTRRRLLVDFIKWLCVIGVCALSMHPFFDAVRNWVTGFISLLLIEYLATFLYKYRRLYLHNEKVMANYFAEDKRRFVAWTNKIIVLMVLLGVLAFISIFKGIWFNFLFQCYALLFNFFVVISFLNRSFSYGEIEKAYVEWEEQEKAQVSVSIPRNNVVFNLIDSKLRVWVAREKYTEQNLMLDTLAAYVGTNHTYLSRFLKEVHGVNFSEWVTGLRIAKAKELMLENPKERLEEVAYAAGFSSLSYFSKVFSQREGVSPARWRESISS